MALVVKDGGDNRQDDLGLATGIKMFEFGFSMGEVGKDAFESIMKKGPLRGGYEFLEMLAQEMGCLGGKEALGGRVAIDDNTLRVGADNSKLRAVKKILIILVLDVTHKQSG